MQKKIVFIALVLLSGLSLNAQLKKEDFTPGTVVLTNGDTLSVLLRDDRDERMSRQIQYWDEQTNTAKRYLPRDLKYYSINKNNYYSLKTDDGKAVFMHARVEGEASLFGYTYREPKGKKEIVTDYYVRKRGGGLIMVPDKAAKFRTEMAIYFSDMPQLSTKITEKRYAYNDMEAVVDEYNEWVKAGKPKNDERFDENRGTGSGPKLVNNRPQVDDEKKIAVELPLFASYNFISYPSALNQLYTTKTIGFGFDVGVGMRFRLMKGLTLRTGINMRDKGMKVSTDALPVTLITTNNDTVNSTIKVREQGRMYYPGIYFNLGHEWQYFHVGGGFNLSFYSFYRGKYELESQAYPQINKTENNAKSSFFVHDLTDNQGRGKNFNMQFDINFTVGGRIKIGDRVVLKPTLMYSIPMVSLYNSGVEVQGTYSNTELNVSGYQLKFGLIADLAF